MHGYIYVMQINRTICFTYIRTFICIHPKKYSHQRAKWTINANEPASTMLHDIYIVCVKILFTNWRFFLVSR